MPWWTMDRQRRELSSMILTSLKRTYEMFSCEPPHSVAPDFAPSQRVKLATRLSAEYQNTERDASEGAADGKAKKESAIDGILLQLEDEKSSRRSKPAAARAIS